MASNQAISPRGQAQLVLQRLFLLQSILETMLPSLQQTARNILISILLTCKTLQFPRLLISQVLAESFNRCLVIFSSVKLLCTEKLVSTVSPRAFKHFNVKKLFVLGWNVLEKSKDAIVRMLIPESVKDKAVFCDECVSVHWNPIFNCRSNAPRNKR